MTVRGQTITINKPIQFFVETCCNCGVFFAMTTDFHAERLSAKTTFWCPNGHGQSYVGKTDAQLRKEAEAAARDAELRLAAERDQRRAAERELKRHNQRAKGGACPCCNRTFVQLSRHMKTKHPEFAS